MKTVRYLLILAAFLFAPPALAQQPGSPVKYLSAASTNSTLVLAGNVVAKMVFAVNSTATPAFLKLYNKATAPTCGTDIPVTTIPVPVSTSPAVPPIAMDNGLLFTLGLGFCLTGAIADNDATNSVTGIVINFATARRP